MKDQMPDAISPEQVPQRTLRGGDRMPCIGMGTFGSDRFTPEQVADAVRGAAELYDACKQAKLTHADYTDKKFTRLKWLRYLLDSGRLDGALRWSKT